MPKKKDSQTFEEKTAPHDSFASLHRSSTNRIIAGVAGGLGEYFGIDPTIIRIIFVLLTFFGGSGILIYLLLWLIMPSEATTSQDPKDHFRENMEDFRESARRFAQDIRSSRDRNRSRDETRKWVGIIILILGFLFLLDNFGIYTGWYISRLWPLILIFFGLIILAK